MILATPGFEALAGFGADVVVIGSGSVGIATALRLAAGGARVLVLESGGAGAEAGAEDLARAESHDAAHHFEPHTAVARRLGGTSNLWAGRCLPFDAIDFRERPWLGLGAWPIGPEALAEKAVAVMNERKITCLFVVDPEGSRKAVGILHIHDCLRAGVV